LIFFHFFITKAISITITIPITKTLVQSNFIKAEAQSIWLAPMASSTNGFICITGIVRQTWRPIGWSL